VSGPLADTLYVAFTEDGIAYVRTGSAVHDDAAEFTDLFHRRFARPLRPGQRPPSGLSTALRTHRTTTLEYDLRELSPFGRAVLVAVLSIPRGQVRPYTWIAHQIGRPDAVRAVGSALGHNPVPVLIPCHRVIRSDGDVGGYVFGTTVKRDLLTDEGTNIGEIYELGRVDVRYLGSDTTGVVCFPSCPNARRITAAHRHGFRTVREAEEDGYRPCRYCQPIPTEPTDD
jgi:O-6-methylguanine DNA methyltransferase